MNPHELAFTYLSQEDLLEAGCFDLRMAIEVAEKTMMSDRAQKLAAETGALVYWQPAAEVVAQIQKDIETMGRIEGMLSE